MTLKDGPWAPYRPTDKDPWDAAKAAHLHRRAGFGAARAELTRDVKDGPAASVDRYLRPRAPTADEQGVLDSLRQGVIDSGDTDRLKAWWLYRVLYDPDPLREKLTLFWHGHFATSNRKVNSIPLMLAQNDVFRRHAAGPFAELLSAVVGDGAMLVWLDGAGSKKEKPNENFGREFLELFTLGVGNYTEKDIREAARAFTGWSVEKGSGAFKQAAHDGGEKTFLKQTGSWKSADVVRVTLEQPACAEFLCRKLYRFFVREDEDPEPELLRPLAEELRGHNYDIGHVVGVILRSSHFYDGAARRQRVKGPVEFSAGLLRTLEVPRADVRLLALVLACERQGQDLFYPPNVKGWDGGKTWMNSTTVLERGNWCNDVVWGNADFGLKTYDPLAWAKRHGVPAEKAAEALVELLLQGDVGPRARDAVLAAGRTGTGEALRKALQLIVHCPEYQLAERFAVYRFALARWRRMSYGATARAQNGKRPGGSLMQTTRRDFLRLGLGGFPLLACGATVPTFLANAASALAAEPKRDADGRILVVVQLDGGNDGLNTVAPYADDDYKKARPKLRLDAKAVAKIDDHVGFHPALAPFAKLLEARQLGVVQSVGYPNPNRSHFESMAIWHTANHDPKRDTPGWLARGIDANPPAPGADVPALHVGGDLLPQSLVGSQRHVPSLTSLAQFRRRLGLPDGAGAREQRAALDALAGEERGKPGSLLQFVERSAVLTYASSARLETVATGAAAGYPEFYGLAQRLRLVSQLIKAGLSTSIYYTHLGNFDTHANQAGQHDNLLRELGASLQAFLKDLNDSGQGKRVMVLVFSEFGRRLTENASAGTDHGTAAPVFLLGNAVKSGLHGPYPNLRDLADGDPKFAIDFRRVYATLLDRWLSCPSEKVLGEKFEPLPVL